MKHFFFLLATSILSSSVNAQNGFYFVPSFSAGISNTHYEYYLRETDVIEPTSKISFGATIGLGFRYKAWRLMTGLQYFTSGYKGKNVPFGSQTRYSSDNNTIGRTTFGYTYHHIGIPLSVGYAFPLNERLSLVPALGATVAYNPGTTITTSGGGYARAFASTGIFEAPFSFWGTGSLSAEYKLNEKTSFRVAPSLQAMLTNIAPDEASTGYRFSDIRNYVLACDVGLSLKL